MTSTFSLVQKTFRLYVTFSAFEAPVAMGDSTMSGVKNCKSLNRYRFSARSLLLSKRLWELQNCRPPATINTVFATFVIVFYLCGCSSMVERQPSKLHTRVRFPLPAPFFSDIFVALRRASCSCLECTLLIILKAFYIGRGTTWQMRD